MTTPPTRWSLTDPEHTGAFGQRMAQMVAAGDDLEGEARLADVLAPRGARVLDAGSGMGRVAAALQARGHRVTAVEPDAVLAAQSRSTYPDLAVEEGDVLAHAPAAATAHDGDDWDDGYDVVVCVGNVMVFVAEGTEVAVLTRLRELLAPGGRVLVGFEPVATKHGARDYPPSAFVADVAAAGLAVQARWGSYSLDPPSDDYTVWVLAPA